MLTIDVKLNRTQIIQLPSQRNLFQDIQVISEGTMVTFHSPEPLTLLPATVEANSQ